MEDISRLPHHLDRASRECKAIIETPKGRRNKFKYKPDSGLFSLSRLLPQGFSFPFDFGFIPSTLAEDGDALDVMVLMDEAAHVGCLLDIRLVGVIEVVQTEEDKKSKNDRLLAVAVQSLDYGEIKSISELPRSLIEQVKEFIALYNKNSPKHDEVTGVAGRERAMELLEAAIKRYEHQNESKLHH